MSFTFKYCSLIFLIINPLILTSGDDIFPKDKKQSTEIFLDRFTVYIADSNVPNLNVHCHSFDDDLGDKPLLPNQYFHFTFRQDFMYSTFFSCNFSSIAPDKQITKSVVFNVFDFDISVVCRYPSKNCYWLARDEGFYFSVDNKPFPNGWTKNHTWQW
ncbi:putative plant self-incompatibility S1 [Helianthus debilis subsp. tardiflorus]